jgi:glycerophosphoryl diester phosphodiesterase
VGFSIEIKSEPGSDNIFHPSPARFVELVLAELRSARIVSRTTLPSFDDRVLIAARLACSELRLCQLVETAFSYSDLFNQLGFVPEVFGPDFHLLLAELVGELRAAYSNLELVPWTVNKLSDLQRLTSWKMTGITTDYPDHLLLLQPRAIG